METIRCGKRQLKSAFRLRPPRHGAFTPYPDSGHGSHFRFPEEFAQEATRFFDGD
jgi:pimeloyl-ACP methyl ester carboxylesterase